MAPPVAVLLYLLLLAAETRLARSQLGYPLVSFGSGDTLVPVTLDGSGDPIIFTFPFPYIGTNETVLYVNTNGILSFESDYLEFSPVSFHTISMPVIAPFWSDVDITIFGSIYYRLSTDEQEIQDLITAVFDVPGFEIRELVVATYHEVAGFDNRGNESNSFQVVLASDGVKSFVFLSYGAIQWGDGANIGFNSGSNSYMWPGALTNATLDIEESSNVGVAGLYVYRVDQEEIILPTQQLCQQQGVGSPEEPSWCRLLQSGSGVSGSGVDGSGVDDSGVDGSGVSGSGVSGSGVDDSGVDGSGDSGSDSIPTGAVEVTVVTSKQPPVLLGDYLVLTCLVNDTSSTEYQFNWSHQDTTLPDETTPTLVLPLVTRRELGVYECTVSNNTARGFASANITSEDPISPGIYSSRVSSSCSSQETRDDITRDTFQLLVQEFGARPYGRLRAFPAASCQEISHAHPELGAGLYWITQEGGEPIETYCEL